MRKFLLFVIFSTCCTSIFSQTTNQKIKVILVGTFHFGETSDKGKTGFKDLFSKKRQTELDGIAKKLSSFGVNKYFLETDVSKQKKLDSLFLLYKNHHLSDTILLRNEEYQIGFRSAVLNNAKIVAADSRQELPYEAIQKYENEHKNDTINPYKFFDVAYPFDSKRKKLAESTLSDYYIQLNNKYSREAIMYDYLHYALNYGEDRDYIGEQFTLSWYDRNLKIFTNILRNLDPKQDKVIVVLFGSSHTAMLRHFFEDHPYFEIVELETVLK